MRLDDLRRSDNVEDRRGMGGRPMALGGGGLLILLFVAWLFGANPLTLLEQVGGSSGTTSTVSEGPEASNPEEAKMTDFVRAVLGETEDVWRQEFSKRGGTYRDPKLVLFSGAVQSACGNAQAAMGPFYCPGDEKVYLDMSFFREMSEGLGAAGDFAQAYVIAHEVGHHVQKLLGISDKVEAMRARMSEREYNQVSVRLELQADFFAGVWARHAEETAKILEQGDLEEALNAASQIGDDRLQKQSQGYVVPDAFTHGTSEQRMRWFKRGYETGDISQGDTFSAKVL
jgi:uncharacterized protein